MASYIFGSNELIIVSLKLLNTIYHFGGGRKWKTLFEAFPWNMKVRRLPHDGRSKSTRISTLDFDKSVVYEEEREGRQRMSSQDLVRPHDICRPRPF
jgi:hypothetical protein